MDQNFSNRALYRVFCFCLPSLIGALLYDTKGCQITRLVSV